MPKFVAGGDSDHRIYVDYAPDKKWEVVFEIGANDRTGYIIEIAIEYTKTTDAAS